MLQIRQGALDARVAPSWILLRHANNQIGDLAHDAGTSRAAPSAEILLGYPPPMPPHQGIGRHQCIESQQRFSPDRLCFASQERTLAIGESDSLTAKPVPQHPVLGLKEFDDGQLMSMHPA
jgi:hypothetical protein